MRPRETGLLCFGDGIVVVVGWERMQGIKIGSRVHGPYIDLLRSYL